ncbi:MAG: sensor histidine kinase [Chloroflexi bacterium]|nr:sensor histidine kinase [Chloroflexota bacterium]
MQIFLPRAPILIAHALALTITALGGAFIARAWNSADQWLAILFALIGIAIVFAINYAILHRALAPLDALPKMIAQIQRDESNVPSGDPQLDRLVGIIETNRAHARRLSAQVLRAQEDERKRIARELHDDTSGSLARLLINVAMCENLLTEESAQVREKMYATRLLAEQTLENIRKLIFDLRPTMLDDLGLAAAVRWYAKTNLDAAGIEMQFGSAKLGRAPSPIETALYRIAQEAITNIIRHSRAHTAQITLARENSRIVLIVRDDGQGFDINAKHPNTGCDDCWGLFGMNERAQLLGGACAIESRVGAGTTVRVEIPAE